MSLIAFACIVNVMHYEKNPVWRGRLAQRYGHGAQSPLFLVDCFCVWHITGSHRDQSFQCTGSKIALSIVYLPKYIGGELKTIHRSCMFCLKKTSATACLLLF